MFQDESTTCSPSRIKKSFGQPGKGCGPAELEFRATAMQGFQPARMFQDESTTCSPSRIKKSFGQPGKGCGPAELEFRATGVPRYAFLNPPSTS
jgi:hypothetical protein